MVLLEDIDAVFQGRDARHRNVRLSFNGLLNALDGVTASEDGRVTFMTTNHLEHLDPALVRPGRADAHVHVDNASRGQIGRMLLRFFPDFEPGRAAALAATAPDRELSMAAVQEYLLARRGNPRAVVADWPALTARAPSAQVRA